MAMNVRLAALAHAQANIGVSEHPPGSNSGPEVNGWLKKAKAATPNPWCAAFDYSMKLLAGSKAVKKIQYPASVKSWVDAADEYGWHMKRPYRGDDIAFSWHGDDPHPDDHIGIVERVLALPWPRNGFRYWVRTVEGNTGDAVRRRWRWVTPGSVAFIRIPE